MIGQQFDRVDNNINVLSLQANRPHDEYLAHFRNIEKRLYQERFLISPTPALSVRMPAIPVGRLVRPGHRQHSGAIPPASGRAPEASQGAGLRPDAATPGHASITVSLPFLAVQASDALKVN